MSTVIRAASHEEFERLRGELPAIGASDLAALLGVSPWGTPFSLWADKVCGHRRKATEAMDWGRRLEDVIASFYADLTGRNLAGCGLEIHVSDETPFVSATPDRRADDGRLVEVKLSGSREGWGEEGTDAVPEHYACQAQQQMYVLDAEAVDFAVLLCGTEFRTYTVKRDREFMARALDVERAFWDEHVIAKVAPPVDYRHPSTKAVLARLRKLEPGLTVELTPDEDGLLREYARRKAEESALKRDLEAMKNRILHVMGDAEKAEGETFRATRRAVHKDAYAVKPQDYYALHVKEK